MQNNRELFDDVAGNCSRLTAKKYSTSFSRAISILHPELRQPIYNIYGLVRFADEIVDTLHDYDKASLLQEFETATWQAISSKVSINPILQSFQNTVNQFEIDHDLIKAFFQSMKMDLSKTNYDDDSYRNYIYGSAEVVGLMCLQIFCGKNKELFAQLQPSAKRLGAAFQKVNFLRDVQSDHENLHRSYFPNVVILKMNADEKKMIEKDIAEDFKYALAGIKQLPSSSKLGVYVAYRYYLSLFNKIKKLSPQHLLEKRVRINDSLKALIVVRAGLEHQLRLV